MIQSTQNLRIVLTLNRVAKYQQDLLFPAVQMQGQQTTKDHHCPRLQRGRLSQMPRRRWHLQGWHSRRSKLCDETLHREGRVGMRLSGRILVQVRDKIIIKLANWEVAASSERRVLFTFHPTSQTAARKPGPRFNRRLTLVSRIGLSYRSRSLTEEEGPFYF